MWELIKKSISDYFLVYLFKNKDSGESRKIKDRDIKAISDLKKISLQAIGKANTIEMSGVRIYSNFDSLETLNRYVEQGILDINRKLSVSKPFNKEDKVLYLCDFVGYINTNNNLKEYFAKFRENCIIFLRKYAELNSTVSPTLNEQKVIRNYQNVYIQIQNIAEQLSKIR